MENNEVDSTKPTTSNAAKPIPKILQEDNEYDEAHEIVQNKINYYMEHLSKNVGVSRKKRLYNIYSNKRIA